MFSYILYYRTIFEIYRNKLPSLILKNTNPQLWTFKSDSIFKRLDRFVDRLNEIKEIFQTANEFLKLEKVEIGGLQGRKISRTLNNVCTCTILIIYIISIYLHTIILYIVIVII